VLLFVFIGWFGSLAYPDITSGNILELMAQHGASTLNKVINRKCSIPIIRVIYVALSISVPINRYPSMYLVLQ
jgi:hypothetical protein